MTTKSRYPLRFVITGTGRCGTGYTARLLSAAGQECGHEEYFRPRPTLPEIVKSRKGAIRKLKAPAAWLRGEHQMRRPRCEGDSSWMAVPHLEHFDGLKVLQLRDPMRVIQSFTGTRFFSDPTRNQAQRAFAGRYFRVTGDDVTDAMRWWVFWNQWALRHVDLVIQLESIDTGTITQLLERLGSRHPAEVAAAAFEVTEPANTGKERGEVARRVEWDDLPTGPDLDALFEMAQRFGYT